MRLEPEGAELPPDGEAGPPSSEGDDAPRPEDAPPLPAVDAEKLKQESELESLLGPDVRTPVGIPKDYRPLDASLTELFRVELADFAGPLDLLLYLIRKHEVDVLDIPIAFIAKRYIQMLDVLQALEIDVAAEFLVLAADLTHIKSKMLLPAKEGEAVEDDEPELEVDPREELVRRLLEYQKYRDAADQLGDRDQLGRDVFPRMPPDLDAVDDLDPGLRNISIFKLVEVMAKMMRRAPPKLSHAIELEHFSIAERIHFVMGFGDAREGRFTLVQLLEGIMTRSELVVTFIAVLEMTKLGLVRIVADEEHPAEHPMMPLHTHQVDGWEDGLSHVEDAPEPEEIEEALHPEHDEDGEGAAPTETPRPAGPTEADGALQETLRLARELEALEASMAAEEAEEAAREEARAEALANPSATPWQDEPLPTIWVEMTGKRFEGDILDDYR
ncbi:MAG: segregation/condensation protein A [Deltaproteobacteria bacterium]|nr:segregation/condensation protein A [Deltaproteobacteria bacterium]